MAIVNFFKVLFGGFGPVKPSPLPFESQADVLVPLLQQAAGPRAPRKRAVLVGINKFKIPGNDLNGCVNDVEDVWTVLTTLYGFKPDDVRVLVDERATKANIMDRLAWLTDDQSVGDQLFYMQSSHGTQVRCRDGDELEDGLDEALVPYDVSYDDWENSLILDDELHDAVVSKIKHGVFFSMVVDACHSHTMLREFSSNPHPIRAKFLRPPLDIELRSRGRFNLSVRQIGNGLRATTKKSQPFVCISGCKDDQTSADAWNHGKAHGALTGGLLDMWSAAKKNETWADGYNTTYKAVKAGGYEQDPQLSGDEDKIGAPIFGGKV